MLTDRFAWQVGNLIQRANGTGTRQAEGSTPHFLHLTNKGFS